MLNDSRVLMRYPVCVAVATGGSFLPLTGLQMQGLPYRHIGKDKNLLVIITFWYRRIFGIHAGGEYRKHLLVS